MRDGLEEACIRAWINLTGLLKNTRIPKGMIYNEATVMLMMYHRYREDGVGIVSFKEVVSETHMLKSLVNRTIDSLVKKGYAERLDGKDKRTTYIRPLDFTEYLKVHEGTLAMVRSIIGTIGEEDAEAFVRLSKKIAASNPLQ